MAERELHFNVNLDQAADLEVDTVLALQDGELPLRAARDMVLTFMVDEDNQPLSRDEALERIAHITVRELTAAAVEMARLMEADALPPDSGDASSP